ncbi:MAG: DUF87 domain-containing protein [Nitratireductor sp.]|nr:DUF87 domain-containing protein [Nitratireductor sp.]
MNSASMPAGTPGPIGEEPIPAGDAAGAKAARPSAQAEAGRDATARVEGARVEGRVIDCNAHHATVAADIEDHEDHQGRFWAVGQIISISVGENRVIGQTAKVVSENHTWTPGGRNRIIIHAELIGEISQDDDRTRFSTGISNFPYMGCIAHRIRSADLQTIFDNVSATTIEIGHVTQDPTIAAKIDFEQLLSRHFAVVGSTGVGKSTAVTLMLRKIVEARQDIRVVLLDPHNEFGSAFPDHGYVLNAERLVLPFWLFSLEELAEVIFRGQEGLEIEKEMLRDLIVATKQQALNESLQERSSLVKATPSQQRINSDTPIPYRMTDLIRQVDARYGKLDNKAEKPHLRSLRDRIESISNDGRFQFMFDPTRCGGDRINDVISEIFRIPRSGRPVCVLEMSGLPAEVVSSVVSVICRLTFELGMRSDGAIQTLVVCEEAHRYIPADPKAGFWPTRAAIGRIAKEGRKYGAYLGIITQRPSDLDSTILSQCNTTFAMRLSNRRDQEIVRGAFSSGAQSTIAFLPSIANRECIAFGEAVYSPMRMTFEHVRDEALPGARIRENQHAIRAGKAINLSAVIQKMRHGSGGTAGTGYDSDPYSQRQLSSHSQLNQSDRARTEQHPTGLNRARSGPSGEPLNRPATLPPVHGEVRPAAQRASGPALDAFGLGNLSARYAAAERGRQGGEAPVSPEPEANTIAPGRFGQR